MSKLLGSLRYLQNAIESDALQSHKIAFLSGARQAGKTTLAKSILKTHAVKSAYYTYDDDEFRKLWAKSPKTLLQAGSSKDSGLSLVVLDEIHKDRLWKNKLKGLYDLFGKQTQFLVTGSARMDYFRRSGDSLQGRYLPYRLHPFTQFEKDFVKPPPQTHDEWFESKSSESFSRLDLLKLGGFPEPLLGGSEQKAIRWRRLYQERLVREDIRDLYDLRNLNQLQTLLLLIKDRAAGQLSYTSLREDLGTSLDSVLRWVDILESVYFSYRIRPFTVRVKNSLRREPKLYLMDWAGIEDPGQKWENLIANHLLKSVQAWTDCAMGEFELHYVRDKQKREVDFLITENGKPYLLLEVKSGQAEVTPALIYFNKLLKPKFCFQIVQDKKRERGKTLQNPDIAVIHADRMLAALN